MTPGDVVHLNSPHHGWDFAVVERVTGDTIALRTPGAADTFQLDRAQLTIARSYCDHCGAGVERATLPTSPRIVWWKVVGTLGGVHCRVRMGRHTVAGDPLGLYLDELADA